MKPNLFNYATSELTNDAMICWMLDWGNYNESIFFSLSKEFIQLMIQEEIDLEKVEITKQYKNIDILVKVNDKYVIVIEDKMDTVEHSNQLNRYKEILEADFVKDYNKDYFRLIYLTIGDESCYQYILDKGYTVLDRKQILNLIEKHINKNDILDDYYNYLSCIEKEFNLYKKENDILKWGYRAWTGFYFYLKEAIVKNSASNWSYVNNPRGGFCAFWWNLYEFKYCNNIKYYIYLQIEENRVAFKVEVSNKEYQSEIRNYVWSNLDVVLNGNEYYSNKISRTRFKKGKWMTIAEIKDLKTKDDIIISMRLAEEVNNILKHYIDKIN